MNRDYLISIIIPIYNAEIYVQDCLESVLNQTYGHFEVIVVDDGSNDKTPEILNQIASKDSRVKVYSQSNQGVSAARNTGLSHCNGEYITMIDGDDIVSHEYLETLLVLALETNADIVAVDFTRNIYRLGLRNESFYTLEPEVYLAKVLYKQSFDNSPCAKLYKRSLWENLTFYPHYYEDLEIFPRLVRKADTITVSPAKLYYYRPVQTGTTGHVSEKRLDALLATDSIIEYLNQSGNKALITAAKSRKLSASFNVHIITAKFPEYNEAHVQAWKNIVDLRKECMFNPNVILKIKLGILLSYLGSGAICACNRLFKISS